MGRDGADRLNGNHGGDHLKAQDGVGDDTLDGSFGINFCAADRGDTVINCR